MAKVTRDDIIKVEKIYFTKSQMRAKVKFWGEQWDDEIGNYVPVQLTRAFNISCENFDDRNVYLEAVEVSGYTVTYVTGGNYTLMPNAITVPQEVWDRQLHRDMSDWLARVKESSLSLYYDLTDLGRTTEPAAKYYMENYVEPAREAHRANHS